VDDSAPEFIIYLGLGLGSIVVGLLLLTQNRWPETNHHLDWLQAAVIFVLAVALLITGWANLSR
jgi:hypothetical protein